MSDTTQNLLEAFNLINPPILLDNEYRLYYNEQGTIVKGTSTKQDHDTTTPSVIATEEQYRAFTKWQVRNGKLEPIQRNHCLQPSTTGRQVVKYHSALLLENKENYQSTQYYE